jgi:hypothetical protein
MKAMEMVNSSASELNTVSQMDPNSRSIAGGCGSIITRGVRSRNSAPWANSRKLAGSRDTEGQLGQYQSSMAAPQV